MPSTDSFRKVGDVFLGRQHNFHDLKYLEGIRGILVIESFLWVFLQAFAPTTVKDAGVTAGPRYQSILRYTFSVLFWNETLIYSAFILISARTICVPFLRKSTKTAVASASFRRGIRLWFPVAVSLAIVKGVFSSIGTEYIEQFKTATGNTSLDVPYTLRGTLAYFNAVFDLFWTTFNFSSQAGSKAFPSGTLWIINVIYMQSYTIYMTMVIIPYTRSAWRVQAFVMFVLTAWWVQSWAWYSITGLLIADAVINMDFKAKSHRGIPILRTSIRFPAWPVYVLLMAAGLAMQYLWTAWRPDSGNIELIGHAGLYYTGGLNTEYNVIQPQARDDNYVFLLGFLLFVETSDLAQKLLSNPLLSYLGSRSLSTLHSSAECIAKLANHLLNRLFPPPEYHRVHSWNQAIPHVAHLQAPRFIPSRGHDIRAGVSRHAGPQRGGVPSPC
jgi:hypothetical protein